MVPSLPLFATVLAHLFTPLIQDPPEDPLYFEVEKLGWDLTERFKVPGVSVACIRAGEIAWTLGCGYADVATERAIHARHGLQHRLDLEDRRRLGTDEARRARRDRPRRSRAREDHALEAPGIGVRPARRHAAAPLEPHGRAVAARLSGLPARPRVADARGVALGRHERRRRRAPRPRARYALAVLRRRLHARAAPARGDERPELRRVHEGGDPPAARHAAQRLPLDGRHRALGRDAPRREREADRWAALHGGRRRRSPDERR